MNAYYDKLSDEKSLPIDNWGEYLYTNDTILRMESSALTGVLSYELITGPMRRLS